MEKTSLLPGHCSAILRAICILVLAATVLLIPGGNAPAFSTEIGSVKAGPSLGPTPNEAGPSSRRANSTKKIAGHDKNAEETLAFNYALPRRISAPPLTGRVQRPSLTPPNITRGDRRSTRISVTFDGGLGARQANEILDILKKRNIKTTIFLTGTFIRAYPAITRRIVADGHEVGNHTTTHPHLTQLEITGRQKTLPHVTKEFLLNQLNITEKRFFEVTGRHMSPLWRAPYGEINTELRAWAYSAGYLHVGWTYDARSGRSLDSLDWVADKGSRLYHGPSEIEKKILDFDTKGGGLGGGIILMHLDTDRGPDRASSVLGEILDNLLERGFSLVKVSDLIVNQRLLREARLKKNRFYSAMRLRRKTPPRRRLTTRVQAMASPR